MYHDRFRSLRHTWRCHDGDLVWAFHLLQEAGRVEVITSTATHAFFPLMDRNWANIRAQVHVAADLYEKHFGKRPKGMWLGECGYVPGVDELLREAAVRYFFVDTHGVLFADRRPVYGAYAPIYCTSGVAAFGRDLESSQQVWSAKEGYPGDKQYRDFYRDIGFDLPMDYIGPYVHPEGHRIYTGIKYHAITHDQLHDKWVYDPDAARGRAGLHAAHFRGNRVNQARALRASGQFDRPPMIVSPYDAELYGHWWYEGPIFLGDLFRQLHFDQSDIETLTPGDYLDRHPTNQVATPSASSWGTKGYNEHWLNETNGWTYRHLHIAAERMVELARRHPVADPLTKRALNQAARELMLAQSSDWTFIMKTGTMVPYATRRINEHILSFTRLYEELNAARVTEPYLRDLESRHNLFPHLDYRIYAS
jgi:1,4-alpha-glucan branching enzyme